MTSNPSGRVASPNRPEPTNETDSLMADLIRVLTTGEQLLAELQEDPSDEAVDRALNALRTLQRAETLPRQMRDRLITAVADNVRNLNMTVIGNAAGLSDAMISRIAVAGGANPRTYRQRRPNP